MATIGKRAYAEMFGPTVGDRLRLADTALVIEIEDDYTLRAGGYGEEVKFGGGKTIRDGMAQSQHTRDQGAMDTVLTNALILDHWGIVKADIGLKHGRIAAIEEKPTLYHFISAGIYVFAPEALDYVAPGVRLDMPDLFRKMIAQEHDVRYHHITEEWIDIGSKDDLAWAQRLHSTGARDD